MKRLISLLSCLLVLCAAAITVHAAAFMGLSASASTLNRGDSFTVYVTLSNDQEVGRGGIVLSYDTGAFEFVGGSCNVSGATLAEVSAGRNGGVFALAENRVVSGTIFTIQMRVRDSAPFGSHTISGSASMDVPCGAGSTAVTVVCKHSYGSFTSVDGDTHKRVCSICEEEDSAAHNWNGGTVKQAATCKATGIMTYTCRGCGLTKEETIPVSRNHSYSNWTRVNESTHTALCTVCGRQDSFTHSWTGKTVTKEATCTEEGSQDLRCVCGEQKTEAIPVTDHPYGAFARLDGSSHSRTCRSCGVVETSAHTYSDQYGHNVNGHHLICDDCGHTGETQPHTPGEPATRTTPQRCSDCGRVLRPALNHVHSFADSWSSDAQTHWYACADCDEQSGLQLHVYDNDCDRDCALCGYERTAPHDFQTVLTGAWNGHWYACSNCYKRGSFSAHTPGPEASPGTPQLCTGCGWELAPAPEHTHSFTNDGGHFHTCSCGELTAYPSAAECPLCEEEAPPAAEEPAPEPAPFPWWIVCILEAATILGLIILLLVPKKQTREG